MPSCWALSSRCASSSQSFSTEAPPRAVNSLDLAYHPMLYCLTHYIFLLTKCPEYSPSFLLSQR